MLTSVLLIKVKTGMDLVGEVVVFKSMYQEP